MIGARWERERKGGRKRIDDKKEGRKEKWKKTSKEERGKAKIRERKRRRNNLS